MVGALFTALLAQQAGGAGIASPLDYNPDLRLFLDSETDVATSGVNVTQWDDADPDNPTQAFDVPGGARSPVVLAGTQAGFDGIDFKQPIGEAFLNRKLSASASSVDNWFANPGFNSISFAARWDRATDSNFGTNSTLCEKGYRVSGGWHLFISPAGSLTFQQRRSNGSTWTLRASGFYDVGDLVLGYVRYNGGNGTGDGSFRLYDKDQDAFITVGTATVGTASGIGSDTVDELIIGNIRDPANNDANAPFEGPLFGLWFVVDDRNYGDEGYLRRYIV